MPARAAVIVPQDYARDLKRGRTAAVQVLVVGRKKTPMVYLSCQSRELLMYTKPMVK